MARCVRSQTPFLAAVLAALSSACHTGVAWAWSPRELVEPCRDDCAFAIYGGSYVENSLAEVLFTQPRPPTNWEYRDDHIIATAFSRRAGTLWNHVSLEPEIGIAQRFGLQDQTEIWGALFFRYYGFPWDKYLVTTVAASVGLNYASGISNVEQDRADDDTGSQLMHFFSPEITFALPSAPGIQLLFRMHHRSGVFGVVSDAWGGAQYGTVGLRIWF